MELQEMFDHYQAFCKEANLAPSDVVISAGGGLALHDIRKEVGDLDLDIPEEDYRRLATDPSRLFSSSMGEYYEYNDVISLHIQKPGIGRACFHFPQGEIYCYSWTALLDQKIALLEMPDRKPEKVSRDIAELDIMIEQLTKLESDYAQKILKRAAAAKARWPL